MNIEEKLQEIYKDAERGAYSGEYITTIIQALRKAIEQRDRMTYNDLTDDERKLFFADRVLEKLDKELLEILEGK